MRGAQIACNRNTLIWASAFYNHESICVVQPHLQVPPLLCLCCQSAGDYDEVVLTLISGTLGVYITLWNWRRIKLSCFRSCFASISTTAGEIYCLSGLKALWSQEGEKKLQYKVFWCHHSVYLTRCSSCIFSVWVQHSQKHPDWLHWRCSDALFFRHFCHFRCTSSFHSKNSICRDLDSSQIIHHSHSHGQRHFPLFFSFSLIKSRHVQASENISNMTKIKTCMTDVRHTHTHTHQSCIHVRGRKLQKQNWNLFGGWEQRFA